MSHCLTHTPAQVPGCASRTSQDTCRTTGSAPLWRRRSLYDTVRYLREPASVCVKYQNIAKYEMV